MNRKSKISISIFLLSLPLLLLASNLKKAMYGCFNGYDLGIYFQAIDHVHFFGDLNPFDFIRGVKIFNDHFDPILLLPALLMKITSSSEYFLLFWEWIIGVSGLLLMIFLGKQKNFNHLLFWSIIYFFSRGFLMAITYPVHASTWSIPFWVLLTYSIIYEKPKAFFISVLMLSICKESYPITFLISFPFFFYFKRKKEGVIVLSLGLIGTLNAFVFRSMYLGDTIGYGKKYIEGLLFHPITFVSDSFIHQDWASFFKIFISLIILVVFILRKGLENREKESFLLLSVILLPLFGLQFLAQNFLFQYSFPFFIVLIGIAYFLDAIPSVKWQKGILLLSFMVPSFRYYEQASMLLINNKIKTCSISEERISDIGQVQQIVSTQRPNAKIISTGGILQRIIPLHKNIYHLGSHGDIEREYDIVIMELNKSGDTHPLFNDEILKASEHLKSIGTNILLETKGVIVFSDRIERKDILLKSIADESIL